MNKEVESTNRELEIIKINLLLNKLWIVGCGRFELYPDEFPFSKVVYENYDVKIISEVDLNSGDNVHYSYEDNGVCIIIHNWQDGNIRNLQILAKYLNEYIETKLTLGSAEI